MVFVPEREFGSGRGVLLSAGREGSSVLLGRAGLSTGKVTVPRVGPLVAGGTAGKLKGVILSNELGDWDGVIRDGETGTVPVLGPLVAGGTAGKLRGVIVSD
jgi:hypothetical protein